MLHKIIISFIAPALLFPLTTPVPKVASLTTQAKTIKVAPVWEAVKVVKIYDGDTFTATRGTETIRIRITWIDTPELKSKQFYSQEAKEILVKALAESNVEIHVVGKSFDRLVAHVRTKKIENLGLYLVQQGAGKAYPTCRRECPETWKNVQKAEAIARQFRMGIWQQTSIDQNLAEV